MGEGEGGIIWENGIETCIILYKKQIASLSSMQGAGSLGMLQVYSLPTELSGKSNLSYVAPNFSFIEEE